MKTLLIGIVGVALAAGAANAQSAPVSPEDALAVKFGTRYVPDGQNPDQVSFVRVAKGYYYINKPAGIRVDCNEVSRAGGKGNAAINCQDDKGRQFRFEWINLNSVKGEWWESMAAKAGQTRNNAPQQSAILKRR